MENPNGFFERFDKAPKFSRVCPMLRIVGKERPEVTILSQRVRWKTVHWTGTKSRPHGDDPETCEGCLAEHPKRLYGYLSVLNGSKGIAIWQVTHICGNALDALLAEYGSLRGLRVRIIRKGDQLRGEMRIEFLQQLSPLSGIPGDVDPEATLKRLWGIAE